MVEESIGEREREKFVEGLISKVKLTLYKCFGREVQFKKYLHGLSDAGTRLLFKFRSGTHGLNEELGRHRGREGKKKCAITLSDVPFQVNFGGVASGAPACVVWG